MSVNDEQSNPASAAPAAATNDATAPSTSDEPKFRYVHSRGLPDLLRDLGVSLLATTYQAGKLLAFSSNEGRLSLLMRSFPHPMGIAVRPDRMALGCQYDVWFLRNHPELVDRSGERVGYDSFFVPRRSHVLGDIALHEIAWGAPSDARPDEPELWIVNTRFSCLCTLNDEHSFVPRWRPPWITEIAAEDRCHLNGVAMDDGRPRYVTVLARTNAAQAWRDEKRSGGAIVDLASGDDVVGGLCMPHSPRLYRDRLWALNSGAGELVTIDRERGVVDSVVARFPGFARGLAFVDRFAFVGLSQARETAVFGELPILEEGLELRCGVEIVDIESGEQVGRITFEKGCRELFDVQIAPLPGRFGVVGFQKKDVNHIFVLPRPKDADDASSGRG
ncbi:MAG: TIGR03032 family protein [Phycisphaerales bacterium]